jgi:hypothetical protein
MFGWFKKWNERPIHREVGVTTGSINECLRELERRAGLPEGDLSLTNHEPIDMVAPLAAMRVKVYSFDSKTSEQWRKEGKGYISGRISEAVGRSEFLPGITHGAAVFAKPGMFYGNLFISKNCPGVFKDDTCTSCGYKSAYA